MAAAKKTPSKKKKTNTTYYPPKTFDDDLASLVDLYATEGWTFSNVDLAQLKTDTQEQRTERLAHDAIEAQYEKVHSKFGQAQEARHKRFAAALNAARGAFRNDKTVLAQLDRFKRSVTRSKKVETPSGQ
ncbi:MAG: hypothetical protein QM820_49110 [Minicystis sp.]